MCIFYIKLYSICCSLNYFLSLSIINNILAFYHAIQFPLYNGCFLIHTLAVLYVFKCLLCSLIFRELPSFSIINKCTVNMIACISLSLNLLISFLYSSVHCPGYLAYCLTPSHNIGAQ